MNTTPRLTAAIASIALTLLLFQGVATLADDGHDAPVQLAAAATAPTSR